MNSLLETLLEEGPVLADGAWGTQLQALGLEAGEVPDRWNLMHPDRVLSVARAYVAAGSRVILTNTFGANRIRMTECGEGDRIEEINREGVRLSKQAADGRAWVAASMGPSGKLLLTGDVSESALQAAFEEQAAALASGGADGIVVETMSDPAEARLAVRAACGTGLPVIGCMVFDSGRDGDRTLMGTTPEEAVEAILGAGADFAGANCGQGPTGFESICRRMHAAGGRPVWIKANAGLPEWIDGRAVYRTTPAEFAGHTRALMAAGAGFLGGCCGTSPEFIQALNLQLKGHAT